MAEEDKSRDAANKKVNSESGTGQQKTVSDETFKEYLLAYIDSYMDYVEELGLSEKDFPLFYTYYPFDIKGFILPDGSSCAMFLGLADATTIEIKKAVNEIVDAEIAERNYDYILCHQSGHRYTKEEAKDQAKKDVHNDLEITRFLGQENLERPVKDASLRSIRMLSAVIPWYGEKLASRTGKSELRDGAAKIAGESLKMGDGEDFSDLSTRLKDMENTLFRPSEGGFPSNLEEMIKPKSPVEKKPEMADSRKQEAPAAAAATVPASATVSGTPSNISIEIKQPDKGGADAESLLDRDVKRMRRMLYNHKLKIEDNERKIADISSNLGKAEHLRQTVFRMNRKVHNSDTRIGQLDAGQEEILIMLEDMRAEQLAENKKMRRFIGEKSRKVRNQAMTVGAVAIVLAIISLTLVIMFSEEIQKLLGL